LKQRMEAGAGTSGSRDRSPQAALGERPLFAAHPKIKLS
jgi:hypothetical protein